MKIKNIINKDENLSGKTIEYLLEILDNHDCKLKEKGYCPCERIRREFDRRERKGSKIL